MDSYLSCFSAVEAPAGGPVSPTGDVGPYCTAVDPVTHMVTEAKFCPPPEAVGINDAGTIVSEGVAIDVFNHYAHGIYEWTDGSGPTAVIQGTNDDLVALSDSGAFLFADLTSGEPVCGSPVCLHDASGNQPVMTGPVNGVTPASTDPVALDSAETVAGSYTVNTGGLATTYASLWAPGGGTVDLSSRTTNLPAGELTNAWGIADNGTVVATGRNRHVYLLTPVPAISGHVANPDGSNVSGLTVTATATSGGGGTTSSAITDANGNYLIGAPAGPYSVAVSAGVPVGDTVNPPTVDVDTSTGDQVASFSLVNADTVSIASPPPVKHPPIGSTATLTFQVTLSSPSATAVTVGYATADGTAVSGQDYAAASGTLTFSPGQTQQSIPVTILSGPNPPTSIAFSVTLSSPVGASLGNATAVGTIVHGDQVEVSEVEPGGGPLKGGTTIVVDGAGFTDGSGVPDVTSVTFVADVDGVTKAVVATSFVVSGNGSLQAVTPSATALRTRGGPGSVSTDVVVTAGTAQSPRVPSADGFVFGPSPKVDSLSDTSSPLVGGGSLKIIGTGFTGATRVDFRAVGGTIPYTVDIPPSTDDNVITVPIPDAGEVPGFQDFYDVQSGSLKVDVGVIAPEGGGFVSSSTTPRDRLMFLGPKVTSVSPTVIPLAASSTLTIQGSDLTGTTYVILSTATLVGPSIDLESPNESDTTLTVQVPEFVASSFAGQLDPTTNSVAVDVQVGVSGINSDGDGGALSKGTKADRLDVQGPRVTSIAPRTGPIDGGTALTITGVGLTGAVQVDFESSASNTVAVPLPMPSTDDTSITVTTPNATGVKGYNPKKQTLRVDVSILTPGQHGVTTFSPTTAADRFTFVGPLT